MSLHGPELKTWRESVHLAIPDLSRLLGIKGRTIGYWENFEDPLPPEGVLTLISQVKNALEDRLRFLRDKLADTSAPVFLAYRTQEDIELFDPTSHRAGVTPAAYRALLAQTAAGRPIRWLEADHYSRWLHETGAQDTLECRAVWATGFKPICQRNAPGGMLREE